jgi:hypothetical protein
MSKKNLKTLTKELVRRFMNSHEGEMSRATVIPEEQVRLHVPRCYLEEYLSLTKNIVPIACIE